MSDLSRRPYEIRTFRYAPDEIDYDQRQVQVILISTAVDEHT